MDSTTLLCRGSCCGRSPEEDPIALHDLNELALDQNFPEPILRCLDEYVVDVRLVPLRTIDARLPTLDDRELVIAPHHSAGTGS